MPDETFRLSGSLRLPGLGVLLLPAPPAPAWLATPPLHAAMAVRLHRPGHPALTLAATIEEVSRPGQPSGRALLLDADPGGEVAPGSWLELLPEAVAFG